MDNWVGATTVVGKYELVVLTTVAVCFVRLTLNDWSAELAVSTGAL